MTRTIHQLFDLQGKTVAIVLSGGNVDPDLFARVIQSAS